MEKEKHYLTAEGKKQLEEKLAYYKSVRRAEVAKKIGEARSYGDLSENSEYDAAKEEQAQVEAEISEMEDILLSCEIINKKNLDNGVVNIGTTVTLYDEEFDEEVTYKILGSTESDPAKGIISNASPVGAALLGHKKGEVVTVNMPHGSLKYKILEIRL